MPTATKHPPQVSKPLPLPDDDEQEQAQKEASAEPQKMGEKNKTANDLITESFITPNSEVTKHFQRTGDLLQPMGRQVATSTTIQPSPTDLLKEVSIMSRFVKTTNLLAESRLRF